MINLNDQVVLAINKESRKHFIVPDEYYRCFFNDGSIKSEMFGSFDKCLVAYWAITRQSENERKFSEGKGVFTISKYMNIPDSKVDIYYSTINNYGVYRDLNMPAFEEVFEYQEERDKYAFGSCEEAEKVCEYLNDIYWSTHQS